MSEWIDKLTEYTKQHICNYDDGDLISDIEDIIIAYAPNYDTNEITLEGDFTINQLQDLVDHMTKCRLEIE